METSWPGLKLKFYLKLSMPHDLRLALSPCEMNVESLLHIRAPSCRSRSPRKDLSVYNTAETPERAASRRRVWPRTLCKMFSAGNRGAELGHPFKCESIPSPRFPVESQGSGRSACILSFKAVTELKRTTLVKQSKKYKFLRAWCFENHSLKQPCHCDVTEATHGVQHLVSWDSTRVSF